jgi:helix-turn-helix protein
MDESVIADFTADALFDDTFRSDASACRVVLSRQSLVVASEDRRVKIDLGSIFDIIVSQVPKELEDFFDQTVLIGYAKSNARRIILVKGDHDRIDKFAMYLYKATLQGEVASVVHPARRGGRVVETEQKEARISPQPHSVSFDGDDVDFEIDLSLVTDISHADQGDEETEMETTGPGLSVRHMSDKQAVTTDISHDSVRKLNILTRYLRLRYFQLVEQLEDIEMTDEETEVLVALYSGGEREHLPGMLDTDQEYVDSILSDLVEKDLLTGVEDSELSTWGQLAVSDRIEDINV